MITFEKITIQNFLSVGNKPLTIHLNRHQTTLIHGPNGSGKSLILDALTYCLFKKSFRSCNLPQLVNTQNKKDMLVTVDLTTGENSYTIVRGKAPETFEIYINDKLREAQASNIDNQKYLEEYILKLNYKSFNQIVVLGASSYMPFMQLTASGRRECVEDFLDLKVFSVMSVIAKDRIRHLKQEKFSLSTEIDQVQYKIELQESKVVEMEETKDQELESLQENLDGIKKDIQREKEREETISKEIVDIFNESSKYNVKKEIKQAHDTLIKLNCKIDQKDSEILFYDQNDKCHTCHQTIPENLKRNETILLTEKKNTYLNGVSELNKLISKLENKDSKYNDMMTKHQELNIKLFEIRNEIKSLMRYKEDVEKSISDIENRSKYLFEERSKLDSLHSELSKLSQKMKEVSSHLEEHSVVVDLLKDSGIKSLIIKKYLPMMNKFIHKYLHMLDLPIHFILNEEFSEEIQSPLHSNFSYSSFSEGQKSRIDLALLFAWRDITKLKNSVNVNLLFLDEVFSSSLDETGKELLLGLLRYKLHNVNVFVVDHTLDTEFKEKFNKTIAVTMKKGFTYYN